MPKANKIRKAKMTLEARQAEYEELCRRRTDNGAGFKRPGSLKIRSN